MSNSMTPQALKALHASITKWEAKAKQSFEDAPIGAKTCPLCVVFNSIAGALVDEAKNCHGCPIFARTGVPYCGNTPYDKVIDIADGIVSANAWPEVAAAEIAFLKSLLPEPQQ